MNEYPLTGHWEHSEDSELYLYAEYRHTRAAEGVDINQYLNALVDALVTNPWNRPRVAYNGSSAWCSNDMLEIIVTKDFQQRLHVALSWTYNPEVVQTIFSPIRRAAIDLAMVHPVGLVTSSGIACGLNIPVLVREYQEAALEEVLSRDK